MTVPVGGPRPAGRTGDGPPGIVLVGARGYGLHHRATIDRLTAPRNYLGLAPEMVDRVLNSVLRDA